jgi:hypothetical protein
MQLDTSKQRILNISHISIPVGTNNASSNFAHIGDPAEPNHHLLSISRDNWNIIYSIIGSKKSFITMY